MRGRGRLPPPGAPPSFGPAPPARPRPRAVRASRPPAERAVILYDLVRPFLFTLSAERAHHVGSGLLDLALAPPPLRALVRAAASVHDPALEVERFGIRFPNPVGLVAGFDKTGELFNALGALGFG